MTATTTALLLFGPHLADVSRERTRQLLLWDGVHAWALVAAVVGLAVGLLAIDVVASRSRWAAVRRAGDAVSVATLFAGILATLCHHMPDHAYRFAPRDWETQTLWAVLCLAVGWSWHARSERLARAARTVGVVLSPAVVVVLGPVLWLPTYGARCTVPAPRPDPSAHPAPLPDGGPRVVFLFDEWSFDHTFTAGAVRDDLPNLRALAARATVYLDAHAPGTDTHRSIPELLFGTTEHAGAAAGAVHFHANGHATPVERMPSLFTRARALGCRTHLSGFYLPYDRLLSGQVDTCTALPWMTHDLGSGLGEALLGHAFMALAHWTDPWSGFVHRKLEPGVLDRRTLRMYERLAADADRLLASGERDLLAVFHYPLPHFPYILDDTGAYRPNSHAWTRHSLSGYGHNLRQLDRLIGRWMAALDAAGTFDDATIVLTSDHGWRTAPTRTADTDLTHVPLIVKRPRQATGDVVSERFETVGLRRVLFP